MPSVNNPFVWYELMTTDAAAATSFYTSVIGWQAADSGMPGMAYTLLSAGPTMVAGLMNLPPEACAAGAQPGWMGYVAVNDVDAMAARVQQAGGAVHRPAEDIPGVGRFAVVADPHGAVFCLFKGEPDEAPPQPAADTPGLMGWHELYAGDLASAWAFYSSLFGWSKDEAIDMGEMGTYQLFGAGGTSIGGMMTRPPQVPVPCWLYYVNVPAIDAAAARVTAGGGQVVNGPMQVPGGSWIVNCMDPQGAMFAMVAPQR
jgi:uncharacterized protein